MSGAACPRCGARLREEEGLLRGRACSKCAGTWFDVLRLESLPERVALAHEVITVFSELGSQELRASELSCPLCAKGLSRGEYARVEVDLCRSCKGLWFDRFEFEGVLDPSTTRPCPKCEAPMRAAEWRGVPANSCRGCGGWWLDVPLLEAQADPAREASLVRDALVAAFASPEDAPMRPTSHACPTCRRPLEASDHLGVELDFCFRCRGLFLDAGEIETVTGKEPGAASRAASALKGGSRALAGLVRALRRLAS